MTLIQQIQQILDSKTISQSEIAQQAGLNAAALSTYLKGKYKGNIANVESALENWLANREKKSKVFVEAPHFIEIPTAKRIFSALEMAKLLPTMVTIYGASGVGKTKAAQEFKKANQNVWMITASPSRATLSSILY